VSRDLSVPVLLGLLLVLALPSAGLGAVGPSTPSAYLGLAILLTAFFALVVGVRTGRPLALLVAALPFLAYGALETPALAGLRPVPAIAFQVVVILSLVVPALGARRGGAAVAGILTVLAGGVLLGEIPTALTLWAGGSPERILDAHETPERLGVKRGAPVPEDGSHLREATRGTFPLETPLYLVFGAGGDLTSREDGPGRFLDGGALAALVSAVELDVYAAAIVLPGAWPEANGQAARLAAALAIYARRGGVLVGPAPGRDWPAPLGQELGAAGRGWTPGLAGAQPFGLGLVVRAGSEAGIRDVLAGTRSRTTVGTVFDGVDAAPPPLPGALPGWVDRPGDRRAQGLLLIVYVVVAVLLSLVLRGAVPRVMGLVAPALAVAVGLVWISPAAPGVRAHALAFELGGGGGRRVEAVALSSGPAGWIGACQVREGGFLRLLGAHEGPDGLVRVRPGRTAWVLRESVAAGRSALEPESRQGGFLRAFLRGDVEPTRLRLGRGGPPAVQVGARSPPVTWILRYR